jgi:hypothetical protein
MDMQLILNISAENEDPDALDRLTRGLRQELIEMGVESADFIHQKQEQGAKNAEAITLGALAIAVMPAFLPKLVECLHDWSMRAENRRVKIKTQVGDRSVEVEYSPSTLKQEELTRLVKELTGALGKTGGEKPG